MYIEDAPPPQDIEHPCQFVKYRFTLRYVPHAQEEPPACPAETLRPQEI